MTIFKVGERARIVIDPKSTDKQAVATDGMEAVVILGLGMHGSECNGVYLGQQWGYVVQAANGNQVLCEPHELRKLGPESDESTARQAMLNCIERAKMGQGAHV